MPQIPHSHNDIVDIIFIGGREREKERKKERKERRKEERKKEREKRENKGRK